MPSKGMMAFHMFMNNSSRWLGRIRIIQLPPVPQLHVRIWKFRSKGGMRNMGTFKMADLS